jgi:hypothetical protein
LGTLIGCSGGKTPSEDASIQEAQDPSLAQSTNGSSISEEVRFPKRYDVRDGMMTYTYSGVQTGSEKAYFIHNGMTEVKYTDIKRLNPFQGKDEEISMITLMRDSSIYVVDKTTMNAKKMDNSILFESAKKSPSLNLNEVAEEMYVAQGGEMVGIDTLLGLPAKHWKIPQTSSEEWRWKGVLLKMKVTLEEGFIAIEATDIDTASSLPEGIFDLPKEVNLSDGMSMQEWMEDLSKPIKRRQVFNKEGEQIN